MDTNKNLIQKMLYRYSVKSLYQFIFPIGKTYNIVGMGFVLRYID